MANQENPQNIIKQLRDENHAVKESFNRLLENAKQLEARMKMVMNENAQFHRLHEEWMLARIDYIFKLAMSKDADEEMVAKARKELNNYLFGRPSWVENKPALPVEELANKTESPIQETEK